jgi:hypothetical protein
LYLIYFRRAIQMRAMNRSLNKICMKTFNKSKNRPLEMPLNLKPPGYKPLEVPLDLKPPGYKPLEVREWVLERSGWVIEEVWRRL